MDKKTLGDVADLTPLGPVIRVAGDIVRLSEDYDRSTIRQADNGKFGSANDRRNDAVDQARDLRDKTGLTRPF